MSDTVRASLTSLVGVLSRLLTFMQGRKDFSDKVQEKVTPQSSKSTTDKVSESVTGTTDKMAR